MKFWDSSAIIPLIVLEPETKTCQKLHQEDFEMVVWAFTVTESLSGLYRKLREGGLSESDMSMARERLAKLQGAWFEIVQMESVRQKAHRLLAVHPLRAGDALQLAAALLACDDHPEGEGFITFDKNLAQAARREGFHVIP